MPLPAPSRPALHGTSPSPTGVPCLHWAARAYATYSPGGHAPPALRETARPRSYLVSQRMDTYARAFSAIAGHASASVDMMASVPTRLRADASSCFGPRDRHAHHLRSVLHVDRRPALVVARRDLGLVDGCDYPCVGTMLPM